MSTILITGASGFIGKELASSLAARHTVVCMSRTNPRLNVPWIRGDFGAFEDLRALEPYTIDVVVHLAAVTGGCLERDGLLVNVEGTRCLMRALIDRGCRKFVMASTIAVIGLQSPAFRPLSLPIPDEHPCHDRDGYGFSKHLMEEVTRYYVRQNPAIDVINLRLAAIVADEAKPAPIQPGPLGPWGLARMSVMPRSEAVRAFTLAVEAPLKPGVRTLNAVGPRAWVTAPVADVLRAAWGDGVDLSHYADPAHAYDAVFDVRAVARELGFTAAVRQPA